MLTTYRALVDCYQRLVHFYLVGGDSWFFYGEGARPLMPLESALRACLALESGGEGYFIYAVEVSAESVGIQDLPVINEFPDEIPDFPHVREVKFAIEFMSGTSQISRAPYCLAPSEMRELNGIIRDHGY